MKKLLSLTTLLFLVFSARADVVEYNYTGSQTFKGSGYELSAGYSGLMIYDTSNASLTFIGWSTNKTYWVNYSTNYHGVTIQGAKGRTFTALARSSSGLDQYNYYHFSNNLLQGLNKTLTIATGRTALFPGSFSGSSRDIYPDGSGSERLQISTASFSYAQTRTVADNNNFRSVAEIVNIMTASLQNRGYSAQ